jgi:hypothetical protein
LVLLVIRIPPVTMLRKLNAAFSPQWRLVVGLLLVTLVSRGEILRRNPESLKLDPDGYRRLAENLAELGTFGHGTTPTAYRPPLYPLALTPCAAFKPAPYVAIAALHLVLVTATVFLVYVLGRRWGLGNYSVVAAALVAFDPILIMQSTLVMTETLATLLATVGLLALTWAARRPSPARAAAAGGCLALAALCRPTFLVWLCLTALVLPMFSRPWSARGKMIVALAAGALVVLAPWAARNYAHFGRPIIGTTHGGFTLLLANNQYFYEYLRTRQWGDVWDAHPFNAAWSKRLAESESTGELQDDRLAYAEAWRTIRDEPGTFLFSCLVRAGRLWQLVPHRLAEAERPLRTAARYAVGLWYLGQFGLALAGLVFLSKRTTCSLGFGVASSGDKLSCARSEQNSHNHDSALGTPSPALPHRGGGSRMTDIMRDGFWTGWFWGITLAVSLTAVHTFYWSNMRMRAPLMPVIACAAAAGVAGTVRAASRKSRSEKALR